MAAEPAGGLQEDAGRFYSGEAETPLNVIIQTVSSAPGTSNTTMSAWSPVVRDV